SAKQWIQRQTSDHFVKQAHRQSLRSRASFKLLDLLKTHPLLITKGNKVLDLGAAPGGWTQVAVEAVSSRDNGGRVIAVDLLPIDPIPGATVLKGDMTETATQEKVVELCGGKVDVVLSDMAHSFTGSRSADVARLLDLCRTAFSVAERVLKPDGNFVCKFIRGEDDQDLHKLFESKFNTVVFDKPIGSRTGSAEAYLICLNYKSSN
ncbi:ribosomal RNA methyltransferase FtsJ domain-containing protein, partial [Obelidium mucronatum]